MEVESRAQTPPLLAPEPKGTHEAVADQLKVPDVAPIWKSWSEVPRDAALVASHGPWFLEIFSGTAALTKAARTAGLSRRRDL